MSTQPPPPPPPGPPGGFGGPNFGGPMGGPPPGGPGGFGGYGQQMPMGQINNYMTMAILTTIFCCLPFGIVSIVNAAQVNKKLAMGDYNGALSSSKSAKTWAIVSLIAGIVVIGIWLLVVVVGASSGSDY